MWKQQSQIIPYIPLDKNESYCKMQRLIGNQNRKTVTNHNCKNNKKINPLNFTNINCKPGNSLHQFLIFEFSGSSGSF